MLVYDGLKYLLRRVLPIDGSTIGPLAFAIAFAGCGGSKHTLPEPTTLDLPTDEWLTFVGLTSEAANEGGAPESAARALVGYTRRPVTFTVTPAGRGALLSMNAQRYPNLIAWAPAGDYSNDDPPIPPYDWSGGQWETPVGFPWQAPAIRPGTFSGDADSLLGHAERSLWFLAGFAQRAALVVITSVSPYRVALVSPFCAPVYWRPGANLTVRCGARLFRERSDTAILTRRALYRMTECMFGATTASDWRARLVTNPAGSLSDESVWTDLIELDADVAPGYAALSLASWTYTPPIQANPAAYPPVAFEPPRVEAMLPSPTYWENTGDSSWPTVHYLAVTATIGGETVILLAVPVDALALPPSDRIDVPDGIRLTVQVRP